MTDHAVRTRILGGNRWQALCCCGWQTRGLRWLISAKDACAGHLLAVQS